MKLVRSRRAVAAAIALGGSLVGVTSTVVAAPPAHAGDCLPSATSPGSYLACVIDDQINQVKQEALGTVAMVQGTVGTLVYYVLVIERCWTGGGC